MRETRVGWLVMYKEAKDAIVSKNDFLEVTCTSKWRGKPKKTWTETVKNDFKVLNLIDIIALNRPEWRCKTHVTDIS